MTTFESARGSLPRIATMFICLALGYLLCEILEIPEPPSISVKPDYAVVGLPKAHVDAALQTDRTYPPSVNIAARTSPKLGSSCLLPMPKLLLVGYEPNPAVLVKAQDVEHIVVLLRALRQQRIPIEVIPTGHPQPPTPCV